MKPVEIQDALYVINKPPGPTSFAQVTKIRRLLGIKKAGHAGTLDPAASGVLLVLTGQATRIARYFEALDKEYRAVIRLGLETDTYDLTGKILNELPVPDSLSAENLRMVLEKFKGRIMQAPPAFSAIKQGGQPLYKAARQGKAVETKARPVEIYQIGLEKVDLPDITITVRCSKGTYIRSLARDLGRELDTGAALAGLVRTAVGDFALPQAVNGDAGADELMSHALTLDQALRFLDSIELDGEHAQRVRHGNNVEFEHIDQELVKAKYCGQVLALGKIHKNTFIPNTVFGIKC
jgi:tRNA pseudouridine55 synthase